MRLPGRRRCSCWAIRGFASICVNGLEIRYEPDVAVTEAGTATTADALALGLVVWVHAVRSNDASGSALRAESIEIFTPISGPVESLDAAGRLATEAQVARLILVRLRPPPFFELQIRSLVGNSFGGEILIPSDGDLVFP